MTRSSKGTILLALLLACLLASFSSSHSATGTQSERLLLDAGITQRSLPLPWGVDLSAYAIPEQGAPRNGSTSTPELPARISLADTGRRSVLPAAPPWGINLAQYDIPEMTFAPEPVVVEAEPEPVRTPAHPASPPAISPGVASGGGATAPGREVASIPLPNVVDAPTHAPDTSSLEQEIVLDEHGQKVLAEFRTFAASRLQRVAANLRATSTNMEVENVGGAFVARYMHINAGTLSLQVKPVSYEQTPFVGVMRYQREIYESTGSTAESAMAGQFTLVRDTKITEIFRYTRNAWEE